MDLSFSLEGNWEGIRKALGELDKDLRRHLFQAQRNLGRKLKRKIVAHILNGDLDLAPNKFPSKSGDPRILIDTEAYVDAITEWQENMIHYIGVKNDSVNGRGQNISEYAYFLEYGTSKMPERPHWRPTIDEMGGEKGWQKEIGNYIHDKLKPLERLGFEIK